MDHKGEMEKDPFKMAELLRYQYESTFSIPDVTLVNLEDIPILAKKAEEDTFTNIENEDVEAEAEKDKEDNLTEDQNNSANGNPDVDYQENLTDAQFNYTDIAEAIDQLSMSSGPGPDGIPAILLKKSKMTVSLMLYNVFHESLEKGEIPEILKHGFICPILKPDSQREKPASWRPISLTSHVIKTLERVIRRHIVNHLELNNLMDQNQHGSRQKRSCLSQLLEHHDKILQMMEEGGNVDVIYTDFEKAFEKVDF